MAAKKAAVVTPRWVKIQPTKWVSFTPALTLGQQVSFGYDANGNLTSFTDARTNATSFAYDVRNRVITKTDALLQAESYQYDAAGNLAFVTDRKGQVRGFTYDKLGRKTQAGFGATSTTSPVYDSTIAYTYDAANRVTQMVDSANGTITRACNTISRTP